MTACSHALGQKCGKAQLSGNLRAENRVRLVETSVPIKSQGQVVPRQPSIKVRGELVASATWSEKRGGAQHSSTSGAAEKKRTRREPEVAEVVVRPRLPICFHERANSPGIPERLGG